MKFAENNGVHEYNQIKLHWRIEEEEEKLFASSVFKQPAGKSIHCREGKLWTETQILFVQSFQVSPRVTRRSHSHHRHPNRKYFTQHRGGGGSMRADVILVTTASCRFN